MTAPTIKRLKKRLASYPGPRPGEDWMLDTDLTNCTLREMEEMVAQGVTIRDLREAGLNRGEVHHILFGYKHQK